MDNNRNNRDHNRDGFQNDEFRDRGQGEPGNRSFGSDRSHQDYGGDFSRRGSDVRRDGNRPDYGGSGSFYGSNRDDYGSASQGGSFGAERGYNAGQSGGGYDEWSRRGTRAFGDRPMSNEGHGGADWRRGDHDRDRNRDFGGQAGPNRWSSGQPYGGGERGYSEGGRGFWDKAGDEVSSWFGDRDAERRRDQDQHRGRGPKGYARSDDRIKEDVNDRLTDDGWLDASNIDVAVKDREVTLSGTVSDRNAKRRAEDIAEGVSGVSHVQNNIRVKSNEATGTDVDVDRSGTTGMVAKSSAGGQR